MVLPIVTAAACGANLFQLLRGEQGRDPGKLEQFFSDHPPSADREARIRDQAGSLRFVPSRDVAGFERMRADLRTLPGQGREGFSGRVASRWS